MAPVVEDIRRLTLADFDAFVVAAATEDAYELIDGELAMMVNPTETHEQIAANIGAPLKLAMDRRGCRTYQGGMRVQLSDDFGAGNSYRPDVLVRCGQTGEQPGNKTYVTDPIVIVEVLSPSTIDLDRGRKLRFYKEMPTVRHIVLAYSDQMRVEHHVRTTEAWRRNVLTTPEQVLALDAVAFAIGLGQIYFDVRF